MLPTVHHRPRAGATTVRRTLAAALGSACLVVSGCAAPPASLRAASDHHAAAPRYDLSSTDDRLERQHFLARPAADHHQHRAPAITAQARARAQLATAAFQDVKSAEAAGWASTLTTLGCFQDPARGGMGVHYVNDALLDDVVDITKPEALVYELGRGGRVTGLVAHEYIVPVDAWTAKTPPTLFGTAFHRHPSLPLYVLHAWLWKDNARGDLDDWNPAVRLCPPGVPIFGKDLPAAGDRT